MSSPPSTPVLHGTKLWLRWIAANGKRLAVLVVGVAFLGAGLTMLVLPGPGVLVIVLGLAVLATEFAWAERMLDRTRTRAGGAADAVTGNRTGRVLLALSATSLLVGGAAVAVVVDGHRALGASALLAGLCSLAVLVPRVQRWLSPAPT